MGLTRNAPTDESLVQFAAHTTLKPDRHDHELAVVGMPVPVFALFFVVKSVESSCAACASPRSTDRGNFPALPDV